MLAIDLSFFANLEVSCTFLVYISSPPLVFPPHSSITQFQTRDIQVLSPGGSGPLIVYHRDDNLEIQRLTDSDCCEIVHRMLR